MATGITIAKLNSLVTANALQFIQEFNKAENVAKRAAISVNKALNSIGAGLSAAGVIAFGKSVIDFGSQITDLAQEAGMGTQAFQTLAAKGAESGVTMEMVAKGAENLRSKLQDAAEGTQATRDELAKLGLTFAGLQSLAPEKQWEVIAQRVEMASDKQEAFNIVSDLFGAKIGPKLKEVLATLAGEDGFAGLTKEMANLRISDAQLKSLDDAGDKLANMWTQAKVISVQGVSKWGEWIAALNKAGPGGSFENFVNKWSGHDFLTGGPNIPDIPNGTTVNGPDGSITHFGVSKKIAEDLEAQMSQAEANYNWKQLDALLSHAPTIASLRDATFKGANISNDPAQISFPEVSTDRLNRIGLMTDGSTSAADENKKQTELLKQILKESQVQTQALKRKTVSSALWGGASTDASDL